MYEKDKVYQLSYCTILEYDEYMHDNVITEFFNH
jgi:hypothetical protein